jgi:hypothetical protein
MGRVAASCRLPPAGLSEGQDDTMPDAAVQSPRFASLPVLLVGGVCGVLLAATLVLWAHYGTAVFFEVIAAGIAACF